MSAEDSRTKHHIPYQDLRCFVTPSVRNRFFAHNAVISRGRAAAGSARKTVSLIFLTSWQETCSSLRIDDASTLTECTAQARRNPIRGAKRNHSRPDMCDIFLYFLSNFTKESISPPPLPGPLVIYADVSKKPELGSNSSESHVLIKN